MAVHDRLAGVDAVEERVEARERRVLEELHLFEIFDSRVEGSRKICYQSGKIRGQDGGTMYAVGRGLPLLLCSRWG